MSKTENSMEQRELYVECVAKQLEEVNLLSSIYCTPGEMSLLVPYVVDNFREYLEEPANRTLKGNLDLIIKLPVQIEDDDTATKDKLEVRIELPQLYPKLENATIIVHSSLLSKAKEHHLKLLLEAFVETMDKNETYIFQVLSWLQEQIPELIKHDASESCGAEPLGGKAIVDFERLWIYSHHIKSKAKRHEILKQARNLNLSGFCRPGKPGIICVEGVVEDTQYFWQTIKVLHWQKISICKSEITHQTPVEKFDELRRFDGFKEQLFCKDADNESAVMDMGGFIKFLEMHNSVYMKKELFGIE